MKRLRCFTGRHRWFVVGAKRDQRYVFKCRDCGKQADEGET